MIECQDVSFSYPASTPVSYTHLKQVIEPICEAKFSDNSYGFRPNRSVEHAVQKTYTMLQRMNRIM